MNSGSAQYSTPNITASEAILTLHHKINIDAPAAVVFRSLRNTETWRDWNRFIPRVTITWQPPENDSVTAAEINELIRNTSIAGSFDSDLTDGGSGNRRPRSPDEKPPPRFRLNSVSSQMSEGGQPRPSQSSDGPTNGLGPLEGRGSVSSIMSDGSQKSGAQLFQDAEESRRSSIAAGEEPPPIENTLASPPVHRPSVAMPPPNTGGKKKGSKPKYTQVVTAGGGGARSIAAHQALMNVYGEPSVRLQIKTKMSFWMRMKAASPSETTEGQFIVLEISRPDDPNTEKNTTGLTRSHTHTLDRAGKYRIVWASDTDGSSLLAFKNVFSSSKAPSHGIQIERVHEIEVTGEETCIYRTWELQKGYAAKGVKKKSGDYLQKMMEVWCSGLKDFCESLHGPQIARRDFSITADDVPAIIQSLV